MLNPNHSGTIINFPGGATSGESKILFYKKISSKLLIVVESTPFHPLDYNWPDQPADKGVIKIDERVFPVENCLVGAIQKHTGEFLLDQEIKNLKIKRDDT